MRTETILHIEDIDLIRLSVASVLSRAGYRVIAAETASKARALWRECHRDIALVITDNELPDGSGLDLSRGFEAFKPGLQVLVTSGVDHSKVPAHFHRLNKPFGCDALLSAVTSVLNP